MATLPEGWPAMTLDQAHARLTASGAPFEMETAEVRGVAMRVWKHAPSTLGALVSAGRRFGGREFLVHQTERVTYEAFHRAVAAFAAILSAEGVGKGDRVVIAMRNVPEWAVAFYGAAALGAIPTLLNAWWAEPELAYALQDSGAVALVADVERRARIGSVLTLRSLFVCRGEAGSGARSWDEAVGPPAAWADLPDRPLPEVEIATDDAATLFYTSGTTGAPRGVLASHRAVNTTVLTSAVAAARRFLRAGQALPDPAAARATLVTVPFFHVTGCVATLNASLAIGAKLVMTPRWDAAEALALIERERIDTVVGVPTIAHELAAQSAQGGRDLSSLGAVSFGGAPAALGLAGEVVEALHALPGQGWGMTETCATVTLNVGEDYLARPDSCGPAPPVADIRIRDPEDGVTELPAGLVGELWSRGPMNAIGYWNQPEATARTFVDGWVRTGDLARLDAEGFCYVVDRAKDMLIRGGENIYCIEVEHALASHPDVAEAAVVGLPHASLGEVPAAVVVLKPRALADEAGLREHVAARLAAFKVPDQVRFVAAPLPRNAAGKVLKAELKALFG